MSSANSSSNTSGSSNVISVKANYTMGEGGHEKGINCIDFYGGSDRPFLVTGSDDHTVRVWDYHTKSCVRVLEGHGNNVSAVLFHPQLPFLLSAGEDATLRIWNAQTFRPEASYNFGMERAWGLAGSRGHNAIGIAFDSGSVVFQLGRGDPCASLDTVQGRLVWSRARGSGSASGHGNEILTGMVRLLDVEGRPVRIPADAEVIPLTPKELGTSDVFPQNLLHSPDGRLVAVWGDGEYVIYSTIGWRNRAFGKGQEVAWAAPGGDVFGTRDAGGRVYLNRVSAHDQGQLLPGISDCDHVFGGPLLGISASNASTLTFYDWTGQFLIRTIDVSAIAVSWSLDFSFVAILTESACYVLSINAGVIKSPQSFPSGEDGIEDAVELVDEIEQPLKTVTWISGNCFVYLTEENRLAYHVVGGDADESFQLALFDRSHFLLGYLPSEKRVYLTDQDLQVTSYAILPALIAFQSNVLRGGDISDHMGLIEAIPSTYHARLAVFLQRRGYLREALQLSPDAQFQFDLAVQLDDLNLALELMNTKLSHQPEKWQELGRVALKAWNLPIAEEALWKAGDLASLFLLYAAAGDADGLIRVAGDAVRLPGHINLAFAAYVRAGAYTPAFELLLQEGRFAEAALFARTYALNATQVTRAVEGWRGSLIASAESKKNKIAASLADPLAHGDKFAQVRFDGIELTATYPGSSGAPRGRSVSFDGNVNVAGSPNTLLSLKPELSNGFDNPGGSSSGFGVKFDDGISVTSTDDQMSMEVNTAGTGTRLEDLDEEVEDGGINSNYNNNYEENYNNDFVNNNNNNVNNTNSSNGIVVEEEEEEPEFESSLTGEDQYEGNEGQDFLLEEIDKIRLDENEAVLRVVEDGGDVYEVKECEFYPESGVSIEDPEDSEGVDNEINTGDYEAYEHNDGGAAENSVEDSLYQVTQVQNLDDDLVTAEPVNVDVLIEEPSYDDVVIEEPSHDGVVPTYEEPVYGESTYEESAYEELNTSVNYGNSALDNTDYEQSAYDNTNNNNYTNAYDNFDYDNDAINGSANGINYNDASDSIAKKEKGSDEEKSETELIVEDIDFGGDGDADGWL